MPVKAKENPHCKYNLNEQQRNRLMRVQNNRRSDNRLTV